MSSDWGSYGKTRPVIGGIKADLKNNQTWWSQRWLHILEALPDSGRLARGRSYARKGQVLDISIDDKVHAHVQGSRTTPYTVTISLNHFKSTEKDRVLHAIETDVGILAYLLNNTMPPGIEDLFQALNVQLFPTSFFDIDTKCTCPDWSEICKHSAAVLYLLGEEFDRDPFLLFTLRGISQQEILHSVNVEPVGAVLKVPQDPPPFDLSRYWHGDMQSILPLPLEQKPPAHVLLLQQLGTFPQWRGEYDLVQELEEAYKSEHDHTTVQ